MVMKYLAVGDVDSAICILSAAGKHDLSFAVITTSSYICVIYIKTKGVSVSVTVSLMHSKLKGVTRY
jgi:molybdate-binding protein